MNFKTVVCGECVEGLAVMLCVQENLVRGLKLKEAVKCLIIKRPRANSYLYLLSSNLKIKSR